MKFHFHLLLISLLALSSCIGDDIVFDAVDASVRILNPLDSLAVGDTYQFEAAYFNQIGQETPASIRWSSSDTNLLQIDELGEAKGLAAGDVEVLVTAEPSGEDAVTEQMTVHVGSATSSSNPGRKGTIQTTSSYILEGSFTLEQNGPNLKLSIADDYRASSSLPGLYVYLTNNPATTNGALEIGKVSVFSGAHEYLINNADITAYSHILYFCKPFNVKVGDGKIE